MATANLCISRFGEKISGQCSKSLMPIEDLQNKKISLVCGGWQTAAEICRMYYGQFDGEDRDFMVCDAHKAHCVQTVRHVSRQTCAVPNALSKHPDSSRMASKSISYKNARAVYKERGILLPVGRGMAFYSCRSANFVMRILLGFCIECRVEVTKITSEYEKKLEITRQEKAAADARAAAEAEKSVLVRRRVCAFNTLSSLSKHTYMIGTSI